MLPKSGPEIYSDIMINDVIDCASRYEYKAFTEASDLEQYNSMAIQFAASGKAELEGEYWIRKYDAGIEKPASLEISARTDLPKWKKWSKKEIFEKFLPVLRALYQADEGNFFRSLVNYTSVEISEDLKAKAHRIDLSFIHKKLSKGAYGDPWDVKNDFQSMFKYVWMSFHQHEQIYKACNKVRYIPSFNRPF